MASLASAVRHTMDRFAADLGAPLTADTEAAGAMAHTHAHTQSQSQAQAVMAVAAAGGGGGGGGGSSKDSFWNRTLAGLPFSRCITLRVHYHAVYLHSELPGVGSLYAKDLLFVASESADMHTHAVSSFQYSDFIASGNFLLTRKSE